MLFVRFPIICCDLENMATRIRVSRAISSPDERSQAGPPAWAGIDIGTQGVRVTLLAEDGRPVAMGSATLTSARGAGRRHEQHPEDWWTATVVAFERATAGVDASGVRAVATCSTSGTVVLADRAGDPLSRALMYDDDRGDAYVERILAAGGPLWQELGLTIQGSWAAAKALWLLEHVPGPASGVRLLHSADLIATRLAGRPVATDTSHALKTGYDAQRRRWPAAELEAAGLPVDALPEVVAPGTQIGELCDEAAQLTGLRVGTRVVAGMTDGCAAQIAAGALEPGSGVLVLGTTLVFKAVSTELVRDPHGAVYCHAHPDGGWLPGGASNVGGGVLQAAFPTRDLAEMDALAEEHEPAGAALYPLTTPGERFPFYRPDAEAVTVGRPVNEADRYAALLQGVGFVGRLGLAALARLDAPVTGRLALTGGATRSRYWCQLCADILDRPVELPPHPEPSVGMAVLAAAQGDSVTATAQRLVRGGERLEPRPDRAERFAERFSDLLDALEQRGYIDAGLAAAAR